jgi:predicted ABC-type ATPase
MGAPGAGKSSLISKDAVKENTVVVNPDIYKRLLPEYVDGAGSEVVHEESSWLARQVRAVAIARSCDLLNDAVGADSGRYADLIRRLRFGAYNIQLLCVHVLDVDELLERVARRTVASKNPADRGRVVPESYVRKAHLDVPVAFDVLRQFVDLARMVDGTTGATVYEDLAGARTVRNPAFMGKMGLVGERLMH